MIFNQIYEHDWTKIIGFILILIAVAVVVISAVAVAPVMGLGALIMVPLFLVLGIVHVVLHMLNVAEIDRWTASIVTTFLCSDLILVSVSLAQAGEGGVNITHLFMHVRHSPPWYNEQLMLFSFVLIFTSWVSIWLVAHPRRSWYSATAIAICVISSVAIGGLLFAIVHNARAVVHNVQAKEIAVVKELGGLPPTNCGTGPIPLMPATNPRKRGYLPFVGIFPVWWNGPKIENGQAVIHMREGLDERYLEAFQVEARDPQGRFIVRTMWIVEGIEDVPVQIRVTAEPSGELIPVEIKGPGPKREDGLLDPADAKVIYYYDPPPHRKFHGEFIVPGSGCYAMEANWLSGSWRLNFALGW